MARWDSPPSQQGNMGPSFTNPALFPMPKGIPQQSKKRDAGSILELLNRGLEASRAPKGKHLEVLRHGESPQEAAANDAWWYQRFNTQDEPRAGFLERASNAIGRGALDVVQDPLSWLGVGLPGKVFRGRSLLGAGLNQVERHGFPLAVRASDAAGRLHPALRKTLEGAHAAGVDSAAKSALARKHGPKWMDEDAKLYGARNAGRATRNEIERSFNTELEEIFKGASPADRDKILKAIDLGNIHELSPSLRARAERFRTMTQAMEHLEGTPELHSDVARRGYNLLEPPKYAKRFVSSEPRGMQTIAQRREAYVPTSKSASQLFAEGESKLDELLGRSGTHTMLQTEDPHLRMREMLGYENPTQALEATKRRIGKLANAVASYDTAKRVGNLDPELQRMFDITSREPGPADLLRTATDFEKAGIFITPTGHMSRIASLALIDDPIALASAGTRYLTSYGKAAAKAVKERRPLTVVEREQRAERMAPSIQAGAVQTESVDRHSPFIQALSAPGQKMKQSSKPLVRAAGHVVDLPGKAYRASQHMLWKFDDEAKNAAWKARVAGGMSPEEAALDVNTKLVDYSNRSGFADAASPIVPFATWRTKAPLAVGRLMLEHPGRTAEASRVLPAMFGGDQKGYTTNTPFADALNALSVVGGAKYARGSVAPWLRAAVNPAANALTENIIGHKSKLTNWLTGSVPTGEYLLNQVPMLGSALQWSGHGPYKDTPRDALMQSLTTVRKTSKKKPALRPPAFMQGVKSAEAARKPRWDP